MKDKNRDEEKEQKPFNVILLGNIESEKEALIHKLIKKKFAINQLKKLNQSSDNINDNKNLEDIMNSVEIHGETVNMKIYDNTSASKVFSYSNKSLSSAQGIILYYSVCDRNSFNILKSNLNKIMSMNKYDFPMVMVGNDSDLPNRQVNYEEAKALADSYGLSFYEVSINSGLGMAPMFLDLGEQVVYREYGNNPMKNNKSAFIRKNEMMNTSGNFYSSKKGKNISIYANEDLYDDEFNKSIKEKMKKNLLSNSYLSSNNKNKQKTNYRTFTNESEDSITNSFRNNKNSNKSKKGFLIKSPDLVSSSVILSYRGTTQAQKIREEEIRKKRLQREREMRTWWKIREKQNFEMQKLRKEKEKKNMIDKIKEDKKMQKEKEKKVLEDNLKKNKLNYEQKKQNNKKAEKDLLTKKENLLLERIQDKKNNKEKLNKLKEEMDIEQKERQNLLYKQKSTIINNSNKKDKLSLAKNNNQSNQNHNKNKKLKSKSTKDKKEDNNSQNNSTIIDDEQNVTSRQPHNYLNKNVLIENYKNNSNIYRCLKCKLIPDILINESNQEIEIYCDHSYKNNLHYNITTYSNFIEQSLNHPVDNNNIACIYCQKYANELSEDKNIFYCNKCDIYFCSDDEEIHRNLMHKIEENIKEKYLNISKNKINEKKMNKKNSKLMMTPMRNKNNKALYKQNTTPMLLKKTNNKINVNKPSNKDKNNYNTNNSNINNQKNTIKNTLPFYIIDTYCPNHDEVFKFYCFDCHQNFCELCHKNHINHSIIKFDDILLSEDELDTKKNELNQAKEDLVKLNDYFTALIEAIKCKFERLFNIKKKELEIKEKIIHDYETIKYNYHSINNIRNIKFNNNDNFMELSPDTDWFNRFNLIFKYLNSNLNNNNNDIFDILNSLNEKNNTKIISKNNNMKEINKLITLNNEDIAALIGNENIIIFDKDTLEEKLNLKLEGKNSNFFINDICLRNDGGLICSGYEFIKFINLGLDNQYYNCDYDIQDIDNNINSVLEFNNNLFISLNDKNESKLWKKNKDEYMCINSYIYINEEIKDEINHIVKINSNSFIMSCYKEKCLCKFIVNNNDKIEFVEKLENINLTSNKYKKNNIINFPNENYFLVSCDKSILLIDKNEFNIIQNFQHDYNFTDIYYYSNKYFIALDSNNIIYKIELDKYQQKLFFEESINLNNKYQFCLDDIYKIHFNKKKGNIILQTKNKFIKIFN